MRRFACLTLLCAALSAAIPALSHGVPPATPARSVLVKGAVERSLTLDVAALRARDPAQIVSLRLPAKNGGAVSDVRGVRLRALLDEAKIVVRDHNTVKKLAIIAGATDGYQVVFSWNELFNAKAGDNVLVLFERDGHPLAAGEGPLALIAGDDLRTGPRHVKWLQSIEVRQIVD
ncbi:molybdopterin-dependent oxidoreductase [Massilia aurea]|uniref:molybdopterin-dependent oxidoreductase n=1 Tax=Massilia aurea TaxID=373040 RepID=UPI003462256F